MRLISIKKIYVKSLKIFLPILQNFDHVECLSNQVAVVKPTKPLKKKSHLIK